jgi:hypothetical protein
MAKRRARELRFAVRLRGEAFAEPDFPFVLLKQDTWDDYGYKTTFEASLRESEGKTMSLGSVKILHRDQEKGVMSENSARRSAQPYAAAR